MTFSELSLYLEKLENTTKRLEMIDILADLITELSEKEIDIALYLALGYLKAPFESKKFNIAERMMVKAIELAANVSEEEINNLYSKSGDLGNVFVSTKTLNSNKSTDIILAHTMLCQIADYEGSGSQDMKISKTAELLQRVDSLSAKYLVRIILGTTRLGFTELTVIDALVKHLQIQESVDTDKNLSKELKKRIEYKYNIHPDIGLIARNVKQKGINGIEEISVEVGVPVKAQKAQRLPTFEEIIEKMGTVWAEYKFDGTRVQLHLDRDKTVEKTDLEQKSLFGAEENRMLIKTYTRNLEETTYQYPDIVEAAEKQIKAQSVILDGEAIGYDPDTGEFLPFQQIMQRKRKHDVKEMAKLVPLKYFVFDILYKNGNPLTKEPLSRRKEILRETIGEGDVIIMDHYEQVETVAELKNYFEDARAKGLEGLILKNPNAEYEAGARSFTWVKLKVADTKLLDDSVDCVVLGYYFGRGVRAQFGIGGFLVGVYDPENEVFKTVTKVGTGLKDDEWIHLKKLCDAVRVTAKPDNVVMDKMYTPDVWVNPEIVVELGADEVSVSNTHSAGYALRFPRLIKFRTDKDFTEATTTKEIEDLHSIQKRGYY